MLCCAQSLQSCLTLLDPMDYSSLGSFVRGILQARILEWVARSLSRAFYQPQGLNLCLLHLLHCRQVLYPLSGMGRTNSMLKFKPVKRSEVLEFSWPKILAVHFIAI